MPIVNFQFVLEVSEAKLDNLVEMAKVRGHNYDECNDRDQIVKRMLRQKVMEIVENDH